MDASSLPSIKEILSEPALLDYLSDYFPHHVRYPELIVEELIKIEKFMKRRLNPGEEEQVLVEDLRITHHLLVSLMQEISQGVYQFYLLSTHWEKFLDFFTGIMVSCNYWKQAEAEQWRLHKELVAVINSLSEKDIIENLLLDTADCSNLLTPPPNVNEEEVNRVHALALLLVKTFPTLLELKKPSEIFHLLLQSTKEMDNLPQLICEACQGQPLPLILIGSLLSLKQCDYYHTWNKVKDDLFKIKESANNKYKHHIFTYCYNDLPHFLKKCFLYLACYPIDYEIPATSLTQLWMAEEFVSPKEGETIEDTAYKYLEQLVERSLVCVLKRSFLGTIKYCQVPRSIHEFVIQRSNLYNLLVTNPSAPSVSSPLRLAVHNDFEKPYGSIVGHNLQSLLAFHHCCSYHDISGVALKVVELRKCKIKISKLLELNYGLRYMGLRGSYINNLPRETGFMKSLQTLDVRDTLIHILPESLWNISTLRHVYINPSLQIKGPPSTSNISNLQILKTVAVHESWLKNFPQCLINLRKLALSNRDHSYWKPISDLLSHMVNLLSMTIIGDINVPSEFIDLRAFPNLETVKSIELEGEWNCRKLIIDNVKFPSNLIKLTLTKSGLKEDPMLRLQKLQALKFLSLKDGAYIGKEIVCSENGFPQLQSLELHMLENLENWEVKPMAMSQVTTLSVVGCSALKNFPDKLGLVTNICLYIDDNVCWDYMN